MENPIKVTLLDVLARAADCGAECLVIGGNAVIILGVPRFTRDIDLAVPETDRERWEDILASLGYRLFHATANFCQFAADGKPDLDLMLLDSGTWQKLVAERVTEKLPGDLVAHVPAPLHLVGMKLHALRDPKRRQDNHDWNDVLGLCKAHRIDPSSGIAREFILRYGGEELAKKLIDTLSA